ncbi:hypothetical protein CH63R_07779 [Colletotrichum higginsianum IMI 349063]|nr:hypothetical protein CH63R_07779 [Colletotrichum higginsianum IMI 349063]OBR09014.1 hypothetical protein CH63R_07779 [Colletotrichum higginsianum IMI 349063]GJC96925.1 hypothetical protein ColKHC_05751 [Colletotrichum higginsianum]
MTPHTTNNRPKTRQRIPKAAPALEVPHIEEDASERKRVLNVLAQRRYRKTHRLIAPPVPCCLVAHLVQTTPRLNQEAGERKRQTRLARDNKKPAVVPEHQVSETCADGGVPDVALPFVPDAVDLIEQVADQGLPSTSEADDATAGFSLDASAVWLTDLSDGGSISNMLYDANPSFVGPDVESGIATAALPSPPSTADPASVMDCSSLSPPEFPDSYLLPMSDLKVLKALLRVATRLGSRSVMWDPAATSPFNLGVGTPAELLPETWRPTTSQVLVPHHPIMDFLPWPDVRDRIINLFSLPDEARPPAARGQLGLVNFAYDLEDSGEGARIWGADPYDESSWEVGQVLFERWWFVFDRKVIEQSNKWRRLRGAAALQMRPGSVVDLSETAN